MAVTAFRFGKTIANLLGGEIAGDTFAVDYLSDTVRCMLTTSAYAYNLDTHETKADVTNEIAGTGYTALGVALGSKTIVYTAANSWATTRANSTGYVVDDVVRPVSANGFLYRCGVAGTSGAGLPTYSTTFGVDTVDGGVTWDNIGRGITQIDAADPQWTSSTFTARIGVIYKDTGTGSTSPLLWLIDFGADVTVTAATFTIQLHALGIWYDFSR